LNKNSFNQILNVIGERLYSIASSPNTESDKKTMWRLPFVKIGFLSVVGSFLLMLGVLAFPATASAYSGSNVAPQRPQLNAYVVGQAGQASSEVRVSGYGFRPGVVFLSATVGGRSVFVQPMTIRTNRNGTFSQVVRIQLTSRLFPMQIGQLGSRARFTTLVLHATGRFGQSATDVLFLSQPYQGFQFGQPYQGFQNGQPYQGLQYGLIR